MTKRILLYWATIITGYVSGSILYGYVVPKVIKNVDICEVSDDGNPGTYNAFKHGGFLCGVFVLFAELLKGMLPVHFCMTAVGADSFLFSLVMAAPVLGHACSAFHHGKGGKAIAVSFGVMLGLLPQIRPLLLLIICYLVSLLLPIRDHRKISIMTFGCFGILSMLFIHDSFILMGILLIAMIVIYKHVTARTEA